MYLNPQVLPLLDRAESVDRYAWYVTFRLAFHRFDRLELDLRGYVRVRGAAFSCLRLNVADIVLI